MARPAPTTLERLRVFRAIASAGTVAGAARALDYTPSAVSQHLAALEREAGVALVERSNRGVVLTEAGHVLARRAADVLDLVDDAFDDIASSDCRRPAQLSIAAFPTAISTMLLPLVGSLAPTIRLTIVHAEAEGALRALRARDVDCAITDGHASDRPGRADDLHRTVLRIEPIRLVTRTDRQVSSLVDCADAPWVLGGADSRLASAARDACATAGFVPDVVAETDDHHITFDVIGATGAVSLLPELALVDPPAGIAVAHGVESGIERRVELVTRPTLRSNPAVARLTEMLGAPHARRAV